MPNTSETADTGLEALPSLYQPDLGPPGRPVRLQLAEAAWETGLLVRSTNWLGDVVMTLPAVYKLRRRLPEGSALHIVCPEKLAALWQCVPWVDRIIGFPDRRFDGQTRERVRGLAPGVTVILPNSFGAAWDLWRCGVPHRIGRRGRGRSPLLHHHLPAWNRQPGRDRYHQLRHYLELAAACGADGWDAAAPPLTPPPPTPGSPVAALVDGTGPPLLVIAPGAAYGPAKQWSAENFNAVARWWTEHDGRVAAVGTPAEAEAAVAAVAGCRGAIQLAGTTSLTELMQLLGQAACVVANDSGVMHLAAALNRPGVAIFGSTEPVATGPLGGRWYVHRRPLPCSPCLQRTCPRTDIPYECLITIPPDAVIRSIERLTGAPPRSDAHSAGQSADGTCAEQD